MNNQLHTGLQAQPQANGSNPDWASLPGGDSQGHPLKVGVWNYYEELNTQGFLFKNANASIGHDLLKPWCVLHAYGQVHGLDFVTLDQTGGPQELDAILFMDRPRGDHPMVQQLMAAKIPKFLCLFETEVIKPDNWDPAYHGLFNRVFTWSDAHVDDRRYIKLNFAIDPVCHFDVEVLKSAFAQRKLCAMVAGAKAARHANELYSERIRTVRWFEAHAPEEFDLYGMGWNKADYPSYCGPVQDKLATLAGYRFAICYENARNYPGYITEKILDCFRAGVVPVYLGAPNVGRWIPSDCFIDRNSFASEAELYAHLHGMSAQTHAQYMDRIAALLASPQIYPFTIESLIHTISSCIVKDVRSHTGTCPDVSVLIPAYNYASFLGTALQSAFAQQIEHLEVLVFDNASTDETPEIVAKHLPRAGLRYLRNCMNIGAPLNWRNALQTATGRYIAILSADDFFLPGHLQRMVDLMDANPKMALAYCPCIWTNTAGEAQYVVNPHGNPTADAIGGRNEVAQLLAFDCFITPSSALIRRSALEQVGQINAQLQGALDWDLWIRLAEKFPDFGFFLEPRVCYRKHDSQDTERLLQKAGLLEDHITILENTLQRGGLAQLASMAQPIIALLQAKFNAYPPASVTHLQPRIAALVATLNASPQDIAPTGSQTPFNAEASAFAAALQGELDLPELINAAERLVAGGRADLAGILYRLWLAQSGSALRYAAAFNLATLLHQAGDLAQARHFYRQALDFNPALYQASERLLQLESTSP